MSITYRRYEILLPRRFNDGSAVPARLVRETLVELRQQFGAASCETQRIQGQWQDEGRLYSDELVRLFVDVEDRPEHRQFFIELKLKLKVRFDQVEIWLTSHPIDVL
jgi:hypothetical protein